MARKGPGGQPGPFPSMAKSSPPIVCFHTLVGFPTLVFVQTWLSDFQNKGLGLFGGAALQSHLWGEENHE